MKREIRIDDALGMESIRASLNSSPVWVFVGSSISFFAPSSIPNGGKISHELANKLLDMNTEFISGEHLSKAKELFENILFEHLFELSPNIIKVKRMLNDFFKTPTANTLHELLVDALKSGVISGIITTNYDLCFEKASQFDKKSIKLIVSEEDAIDYSDGDRVIFKIHGTCNDYEGQDLHCTLKDEGRMPDWKTTFLKRILNHANIIFTGYSGFDFEICQEIQQFDNLEKVVWNDLKPYDKLSNNARGIIDKFNGITLIGDMGQLIHFLCNKPYSPLVYDVAEIDSRLNELVKKFADTLSRNEIFAWYLNTLTSCGFARASVYSTRMVYSNSACINLPRAFYRENLAAAMYKMGLYRKSLYYYLLAAYSYRARKYDYIRILIDAAEACKAGFRLATSILLLRYCRKAIQKNKNVLQTDELLFLVDRLNNRKNEIGARISKLKLGGITKFILDFIGFNSVEDIQTSSARRGDWILNFNDRVTHARGLASSSEYKEISEKMYEMGLKFEYYYDFRRFLEKKHSEEGKDAIIPEYSKNMEDMMKDEEIYGIYPELWKLKRFCNDIELNTNANNWAKYFWKCQYSFYGRALLLLEIIHV